MKYSLTIFFTALLAAAELTGPTRARADLPALDPNARPLTRLGPKYELALNVSLRGIEERELCRTYTLDADAQLQIKIADKLLPKVACNGQTIEQARPKIVAVLSPYFRVTPEVKVGITRIPRFQVQVFGATFRQGQIALPEGAHLSDAIAEARFFQNADLSRVRIERTEKDGSKTTLTADFSRALRGEPEDGFTDPLLQEKDQITVEALPTVEAPAIIGVIGDVRNQGSFPYKKGMTVRDALTEAQGMLPGADPERVTIARVRRGQYMTVNGVLAMQNVPTENLELEKDDIVSVATKDKGHRYSVRGEVASPATFDFKPGVTFRQAIIQSGGLRPSADRKNVVLLRNMLQDPANSQPVIIDVDKVGTGGNPDIPLEPGDVIVVSQKRKQNSPLVDIGLFILRRFLPF
jgi:protein involved in polysaccharide export with SLBB domain